MTPRRLTDQQAEAAYRPEGDACVLAGAGSGKTTVLTERFRHAVAEQGASPRRVAALTFTDKAAGQMRERIAQAFAADPDPAVRARAREVEFAPISTIHAFGARLLREHAVDAGVDPAFVLLDENEARLLLEEAWERVDRRLRRRSDPALEALHLLGDEDAHESLLDLLDRLRGLAVDPARLELARAARLPDALDRLEAARADLVAAVGARGLRGAALEAYERTLAALPGAEELRRGGLEAARRALALGRGKLNDLVALPTRCATDERAALQEAFAAVGGAVLDEALESVLLPAARALLVALDAEYAKAKEEQGALDFADLELRTVGLLDGLAERRRPLEGAPRRLLVDEFQDTNPLQQRILARLREGPSGRAADLFAVGDPKQSIYRFRRADVGVMLGEWDRAGPRGRTKLAESFRSRPELVAFHNAVFPRLFAAGAAGVEYEPLVARGSFALPDEEVAPLALLVDASGTGLDAAAAEARAVAARLRALVEEGALRTRQRLDDEGRVVEEARPLRWGDMAVLVRANASLRPYERAFLAAGVPFAVGRGRGFYDTPEIADLVHALRVVHDPKDRFAVAAWLASPAVGACDEDLLACFAPGAEPFEAASARASTRDAVGRVGPLRRLAASGGLEALVRATVDAFRLDAVALLQPGGARRARNLEKAVAIARRLDDDGGHGLLDFLRRLQDLRDREVEEPEAAAAGTEDAVSLLTVHSAKGLEWPVVVVGAMQRAAGGGDDGPWAIGEDGRVGWRILDPREGTSLPGAGYSEVRRLEKEADAREERRLLYVAMTRAEERLILAGSIARRTNAGAPNGRYFTGWAAQLLEAVGDDASRGERVVPVGGARLRVVVEAAAAAPQHEGPLTPWARRYGPARILGGPAPAAAGGGDPREAWARLARPVPTLRRTPFVVTISDLLNFAHDPAAWYEARLVGPPDEPSPRPLAAEREDPASASEEAPDASAAARASRWDEGREVLHGVDRAALGRAVHAVLEGYSPGGWAAGDAVAAALAEEFAAGPPAAALEAAQAMVERFLRSPAGRDLAAALEAGRPVRREAAFHARVKFPEGAKVAGFDALLLKGSVDLWLPRRDGRVRILDHKTNSPLSRLATREALAAHYAPQIRLYALAAERVTGEEVADGGLLLLDPGWGEPVEAPVDVSGEALEDARRLCLAFARAMAEDRYPRDWRSLL